MPYTVSKTTNPLEINEQEYASGSEIKFTAFTSCIDVWNNPANGEKLHEAFQKLTGELKTSKKYQQCGKDLGTYGAKIDGDDIKITF